MALKNRIRNKKSFYKNEEDAEKLHWQSFIGSKFGGNYDSTDIPEEVRTKNMLIKYKGT